MISSAAESRDFFQFASASLFLRNRGLEEECRNGTAIELGRSSGPGGVATTRTLTKRATVVCKQARVRGPGASLTAPVLATLAKGDHVWVVTGSEVVDEKGNTRVQVQLDGHGGAGGSQASEEAARGWATILGHNGKKVFDY
jgi:hypothetical protein